MRVNSGTLGNLGRVAVFAAAGFIGSNANAQEPILKQSPIAQISEDDKSLEKKIRELEKLISEQQKEIVLNRSEIEGLKADKYTKYIPITVYVIAILLAIKSFSSRLKADSKSLNNVFEKGLEEGLNEFMAATREGIKALEERLREEFQGGAGNPLNQMFNVMSKGISGARLTSALHHVLSQLDDDFSTAVREGNFGAAGGIDNIESLHAFLNGQSELFKEYATYTDEERKNLPVISFGKKMSIPNHEHDEGDIPGNETSETNLVLIPNEFQSNANLYITLIAREFSRVIHMPEEGYKTLAESQITAFEKEIDLIENTVLLLNKLNAGIGFDDLNQIFNFEIAGEDFEGFKMFVESLGLDPKTLKEIIAEHLKELEGWKAIQKKA